jgi:argininosuccinate lyase
VAEFKTFSSLFEQDIFQALALETVVDRRNSYGGTGAESVTRQLEVARDLFARTTAWVDAVAPIVRR